MSNLTLFCRAGVVRSVPLLPHMSAARKTNTVGKVKDTEGVSTKFF
jgi:hypothetical protein